MLVDWYARVIISTVNKSEIEWKRRNKKKKSYKNYWLDVCVNFMWSRGKCVYFVSFHSKQTMKIRNFYWVKKGKKKNGVLSVRARHRNRMCSLLHIKTHTALVEQSLIRQRRRFSLFSSTSTRSVHSCALVLVISLWLLSHFSFCLLLFRSFPVSF